MNTIRYWHEREFVLVGFEIKLFLFVDPNIFVAGAFSAMKTFIRVLHL